MQFSFNFIKELVDIKVRPQKLASSLTMAGMEVEGLEFEAGDWIFDIEVTTNRYDWLSMVGIAREIAAITGGKLKLSYPKVAKEALLRRRKIIIEDREGCPYYIGRTMQGVAVGASPAWLRERLAHCGVNSVNDIVDITNYCMLKWGNPLHAFDDDKIDGDICIRRARKGEPFVGIDEKERTLDKTNLVIADDTKVIALAGVMGAKNSEVTRETKSIFLEAALFSPLIVRRSRRVSGLDTESSYRFERRVSPRHLEYASCEATRLMQQIGGAHPEGLAKAGKAPTPTKKKIAIQLSKLNEFLGGTFPKTEVKTILKNLGCSVQEAAGGKFSVVAPLERFDIQRDVDIYEEFARIYGYDRIKPQIPALTSCLSGPLARDERKRHYYFKNDVRRFLSLHSFKEIITFSLDDVSQLNELGQGEAVEILNPLRSQENALRTTLALGMIRSMQHNSNRGQKGLRFFEVADIYRKQVQGFFERPALALGVTGEADDFFFLKSVVQEVLSQADIAQFSFEDTDSVFLSEALAITSNKQIIGFLGRLGADVRKSFDIKEEVFFAQLDMMLLWKLRTQKKYVPFSLYPAMNRDISIILQNEIRFSALESIIKEKSSNLIDMRVVDIYKGKDVSVSSKAFTLRLFYQSPEKTLTSAEVDTFHNTIRDELAKVEGVTLR